MGAGDPNGPGEEGPRRAEPCERAIVLGSATRRCAGAAARRPPVPPERPQHHTRAADRPRAVVRRHVDHSGQPVQGAHRERPAHQARPGRLQRRRQGGRGAARLLHRHVLPGVRGHGVQPVADVGADAGGGDLPAARRHHRAHLRQQRHLPCLPSLQAPHRGRRPDGLAAGGAAGHLRAVGRARLALAWLRDPRAGAPPGGPVPGDLLPRRAAGRHVLLHRAHAAGAQHARAHCGRPLPVPHPGLGGAAGRAVRDPRHGGGVRRRAARRTPARHRARRRLRGAVRRPQLQALLEVAIRLCQGGAGGEGADRADVHAERARGVPHGGVAARRVLARVRRHARAAGARVRRLPRQARHAPRPARALRPRRHAAAAPAEGGARGGESDRGAPADPREHLLRPAGARVGDAQAGEDQENGHQRRLPERSLEERQGRRAGKRQRGRCVRARRRRRQSHHGREGEGESVVMSRGRPQDRVTVTWPGARRPPVSVYKYSILRIYVDLDLSGDIGAFYIYYNMKYKNFPNRVGEIQRSGFFQSGLAYINC